MTFPNLRRLVFTKDGDLDLGWLLGSILMAVGVAGFVLEATGRGPGASEAGWVWLGSTTALLLGAGAAVSRGRLLGKARVLVSEARAGAASDVAAAATDVAAAAGPEGTTVPAASEVAVAAASRSAPPPAPTIPETLADIRRDDETDPEWPERPE